MSTTAYIIIATPEGDGPAPEQRLRLALKRLKRAHGLRAVTVGPMPDPGQSVRRAFVDRLADIAEHGDAADAIAAAALLIRADELTPAIDRQEARP